MFLSQITTRRRKITRSFICISRFYWKFSYTYKKYYKNLVSESTAMVSVLNLLYEGLHYHPPLDFPIPSMVEFILCWFPSRFVLFIPVAESSDVLEVCIHSVVVVVIAVVSTLQTSVQVITFYISTQSSRDTDFSFNQNLSQQFRPRGKQVCRLFLEHTKTKKLAKMIKLSVIRNMATIFSISIQHQKLFLTWRTNNLRQVW